MTFLACLTENKSALGIKAGTGNQMLGLLKQDYHQRLGGIIGNKRIPSTGQVTDTNT